MLPDTGEIIVPISLLIYIPLFLVIAFSAVIIFLALRSHKLKEKQTLRLRMNRILEAYLQEVSREKKQNSMNVKKLLQRFVKAGVDLSFSSYGTFWTLHNGQAVQEAEYKEKSVQEETYNELKQMIQTQSPHCFAKDEPVNGTTPSGLHYLCFPTKQNSELPSLAIYALPFEGKKYSRAMIEILTDFLALGSRILENILIVQDRIENDTIRSEAVIASNIQNDFIPTSLPETKDLAKSVFYKSLSGINSDYYDIVSFKNKNKTGFILCHVAGKGLHSALVMVMIYSIFHFISRMTRKTGTVLELLNRGLLGKIGKDRFAAISYALYDPEDKVISYSAAGQTPLLHFGHEEGIVKEYHENTLPVGIDKNEAYPITRIPVTEGDLFMMFTDGIIETVNDSNEQFGIDRLKKLIADNYYLTADDLKNKIKESLDQFRGDKDVADDMTAIIIKVF